MARRFLAKDVPYQGTTVSVDETKMQIDMMLKEFGGVSGIRWTESADSLKGVALPLLEFIVIVNLEGVEKEMIIRVSPVLLRKSVGRGYNKRHTYAPEQSMRMLFWWLKARLEAVKFGLESIEQTLLSRIVISLEDGGTSTVGETVIKQLSSPFQSKNLLPGFTIDGEAVDKTMKKAEVVEEG